MRTSPARRSIFVALLAVAMLGTTSATARRVSSQALSVAAVNEAPYSAAESRQGPHATMLKAEVLLDRLGFSPGIIDGRPGENAGKAIAEFQRRHELAANGKLDRPTFDKLAETTREPALIDYTITEEDVRGPFVPQIPRDLEGMASLPRLAYRGAAQLLAEKFHTGEDVLKLLNRGKTLDRAGVVIAVPNVAAGRPGGAAARIEVDKTAKTVRALGSNGELIAFYPASIGSGDKPAPSGNYAVRRVVEDPDYHYDPNFNFKGVKSKSRITVAAGPNNPVGAVWIDLTKSSYGIHGTPNPEKIGKTQSHGCIRLTNWDALDLARRVRKGVAVSFLDQARSAANQ